MGGTSTDVCLISGGRADVSTEGKVGGLAIGVPAVEIVSVGAGGGSIAWMDQGGLLRVGPMSAGSEPGPACYGRGGASPTLTDAQVVRGIIRETQFIGGKLLLRGDLATPAVQSIGTALGLNAHEAADAMVRIGNNNVVQAVRVVSAERGHDPRDYVLVAFGGAGPLHAADVADALGMNRVLVPRNAGLFSALGLLLSDFKRDYAQTQVKALDELTEQEICRQISSLTEHAKREFAEYGLAASQVSFSLSLDMRYQGQAFEISVGLDAAPPNPEDVRQRFERAYLERYGYVPTGQRAEVVTYRVAACSARSGLSDAFAHSHRGAPKTPDSQSIFYNGSCLSCAFYSRDALADGQVVPGPAVVEEDSSACFIPPGWTGRIDHMANILLEKEGQGHA
jgi:N-methylhydantoinase A